MRPIIGILLSLLAGGWGWLFFPGGSDAVRAMQTFEIVDGKLKTIDPAGPPGDDARSLLLLVAFIVFLVAVACWPFLARLLKNALLLILIGLGTVVGLAVVLYLFSSITEYSPALAVELQASVYVIGFLMIVGLAVYIVVDILRTLI
jgi:hypothetical protein